MESVVIGREVVHSSARTGRGSDDWQTPAAIWQLVAALGVNRDIYDPCPPGYTPGGEIPDGLKASWPDRDQALCYVNPPYSRVADWIARCEHAAVDGSDVIALVPARTGPRWFQGARPTSVYFLAGRLRFVGASNAAPFDSMLMCWGVRGVALAARPIGLPGLLWNRLRTE